MAREAGLTAVGAEHVTLAILRDPDAVPTKVSDRIGPGVAAVAETLEQLLRSPDTAARHGPRTLSTAEWTCANEHQFQESRRLSDDLQAITERVAILVGSDHPAVAALVNAAPPALPPQ
ncbi:MAG: hypothetical protein J2P17_01035 [Mycobacterium sp.]|nr:hypothetical protein [Mycobacterium sp.]